jgi:hypothetical protein
MRSDWENWEGCIRFAVDRLLEMPTVLSGEDFQEILKLLPLPYELVSFIGTDDDVGLNKRSVHGLLKCFPMITHCHFTLDSIEWDKQPGTGKYISMRLYRENGVRVLLGFISADEVSVKYSVRRPTYYNCFNVETLRCYEAAQRVLLEEKVLTVEAPAQ